MQEHLLKQAHLSDLDEEEMEVAEVIIGNIDGNGFLQATLEELIEASDKNTDVVDEVLSVIRSFEPAGVGAADLRECLLMQLERAGKIDSLEYRVIDQHMDALGRRRFPEIARAIGVEGTCFDLAGRHPGHYGRFRVCDVGVADHLARGRGRCH